MILHFAFSKYKKFKTIKNAANMEKNKLDRAMFYLFLIPFSWLQVH